VGGLVLAAVAGLIVDLPALALGVKLTSSHTPRGIELADTFVQDLAFVAAAVYCAHLGGRRVTSAQFGLRTPRDGWGSAAAWAVLLLLVFLLVSVGWAEVTNVQREKVLDTLGADFPSALVICVVAPMCEEMLFRGYIFTALRSWRGTGLAATLDAILFGAVHAGSAPVLDLVPLGLLGFGLCLLYRRTRSLYPGMAVHSMNNSVAFAGLAGLNFGEGTGLAIGALAGVALIIAALMRVGLIARSPARARPAA
jgi:membrane protease YdiL (CAAX protease family)